MSSPVGSQVRRRLLRHTLPHSLRLHPRPASCHVVRRIPHDAPTGGHHVARRKACTSLNPVIYTSRRCRLVSSRERRRTHSQRVGMSLLDPDTYKLTDAEVLALINEQALKEKDAVR